MFNRTRWLSASTALLLLACGTSQPPPETASAEPGPAPSAAEAPPDEAPPPASSATDDPGAEPSAAPADSAAATESEPKRQVKYIVTPTALEVEVEGVRFVNTAEVVKLGDAWGVRVKTVAKVKDGKPHQLLTPKGGPLAFAGSVTRGGKTERFGDKREGSETVTLKSAQGVDFVREWPEKGGVALEAGDELKLEVGLWALGNDAESRRPLRDFLLVKVKVGKGKPIAVLLPPAGAGKE
jgi:hypothetical protein